VAVLSSINIAFIRLKDERLVDEMRLLQELKDCCISEVAWLGCTSFFHWLPPMHPIPCRNIKQETINQEFGRDSVEIFDSHGQDGLLELSSALMVELMKLLILRIFSIQMLTSLDATSRLGTLCLRTHRRSSGSSGTMYMVLDLRTSAQERRSNVCKSHQIRRRHLKT
jgi:hypothetical protein